MKTRKRVEIARTGTFPLSSGRHTFTRAQLAAAVRNAEKRRPRIGIGHKDPRWKAASDQDGDPALGLVDNLTLEEDGDLLVGDFVDIPDWFDRVLPSKYPGRSLEGPCEGDDLTIETVKLLGTTMPGIHSLDDLRAFVSDEGPALVAAGADNDGHQITVFLTASSDEPTPSTQEVVHVDPKKEMRKALGLPEDATDEQVKEAFAKQFEPAVAKTDDDKPGDTDPSKAAVEEHPKGEPKEPEKEPLKPAEEKADPVLPEGTVAIDGDTLKELQVAASRADGLYEQDRVTKRDSLLDEAQREGRIPLARRPHYSTMYDKDPEGTRKLLTASAADGGLAPGLVPVDKARGHSEDIAASAESELLVATRKQLGIKTPTEA
jgi:hypothetical protein